MQLPLHKKISNQELSEILLFIAGVLSLKSANRFRVRAYQNASAVIEQLHKPWYELFLSDEKFSELPGIGETLQAKLTELYTTGNIKAFQEYVSDIPIGTYVLDKVPGLGVKKGYKLATLLQLDDAETAIPKVLAAAQAGKIREIEGFGEKSEADLLVALKTKIIKTRLPIEEVLPVANALIAELKTCPEVTRAEALGSLRRRLVTVGDIDLGIAVSDPEKVKKFVSEMKAVKQVLVAGDQLMRVLLQDGHQVDIKVSTPEEWGAFLQHFTGSKEHNIKLREFALKQAKSLSEHGIKITTDEGEQKLLTFSDEKDFYKALGLRWIPPEEREGKDEIARFMLYSS